MYILHGEKERVPNKTKRQVEQHRHKHLYTIKGGFQKPIVEAAFELILLVIFKKSRVEEHCRLTERTMWL